MVEGTFFYLIMPYGMPLYATGQI